MLTAITPPSTGTRPRHAAAILAIVLVSYFVILLDNSVIFTGIPSIQADLDLSPATLAWVQDAYVLVFGGLLLLGARAGDLLGRQRVYVAGLAIFGAASLLVGCAPSGGWLIGARALQGIGAAVVAPTSLALITAHFTGRVRARAIAWYAATAGIGASLGLLVGGAAAQWVSWRAGFLINVPITIALAFAAIRYIPRERPARGRFDAPGAIFATLGVGSLVYGVINSTETGWTSASTIGPLVGGALLLAALVLNERRAEQPIMPLRLFASWERSGAYATRMLYLGAMMGFFFFTTQYLQEALGFTPLQAGAAFLPMTAVNFAVAMAIPRLSRHIQMVHLLVGGVALTFLGMAWLSRVGLDTPYLTAVALPMVLIGLGQGLAFAPMTSAGVAHVTPEDAGAASGLVNTAHQIGSALGLGILVAIAAHAMPSTDIAAEVTTRTTAALTGSSVFLAIALVIAVIVAAQASRSAKVTTSQLANT